MEFNERLITQVSLIGNCHFDEGFCQWKNQQDQDDFNWTLLDKGTPSTLTGPDHPYNGKGIQNMLDIEIVSR